MFGKEPPIASPADAYPGLWVLRDAGKDYPASTFEDLINWFKQNRVSASSQVFHPKDKKWYPSEAIVPLIVQHIPITTTPTLEGYRVSKYVGIESVEVVIGTGPFTEFGAGVADFFGQRSTGFELKLQQAKQAALQKLRFLALRQGGNAVIGVDLDYTEFSGNRIGVVANGTIVEVEKMTSA